MLEREGARTTLVMALLAAVFVVTAIIVARGVMGVTYHRTTAQKVVRDWAHFANAELLRRAENQASFYGTYPILQMLAAIHETPTRAELLTMAHTGEERRNARLVRRTIRIANGTLTSSDPLSSDEQTAFTNALHAAVAAKTPASQRGPIVAGDRTLAWLPSDSGVVAIDVDRDAIGPFFASALTVRPVIPPFVGWSTIGNDALIVRVTNPAGRVVFKTAGNLDAQLSAKETPEDGLLRGFTIETSLAPDAARRLVLGGLAQPTAIYFVLLVVAGALLAFAILQVRKERQLARMRSDFVSSVSHELRTPLAQIRMFAETLMLDRIRSDEERKRSLTVIDQETRRLAQLVENVLQFSRGERGTLRIVRVRRDVASLVEQTVHAFAPIAAARNVRITTELQEALADVDDDALRQVVLNLLDNAVKYGPDEQEIIISVLKTGDEVRIAVDDQGPGIPERERERIWRRYIRLERERERAIAGAGIGLAVVREIVALHGGRAFVEEGTRGGARFVIVLPAEVRA